MNRVKSTLLLAGFGFALALTLSCGENDSCWYDDGDGGSNRCGVAKAVSSSSAEIPLCGGWEYDTETYGCCKGIRYPLTREHYGKIKSQFCDERDGKTYVYVPIVTGATAKNWMAENLNYAASGSKCGDDANSTLSDANTDICNTYGRLYNWSTATQGGVCPRGWHIPSDTEWNVLMEAVGGEETAGTKLKAADDLLWSSGKGTDDYGFAALPGGYGEPDGSFGNTDYSYWWSTKDSDSEAYYRYVDRSNPNVSYGKISKDYLFFVRCLKNAQ